MIGVGELSPGGLVFEPFVGASASASTIGTVPFIIFC